MLDKVLLVVQRQTSDPGRVGAVLSSLGYTLDIRRPALGEALPAEGDDHVGAVVFGGPMSANDEHLPFIRTELEWIPLWLRSERPFLGICLGAQLLTKALGGRVEAHPEGWHEIGYYPIEPTPAGREVFGAGFHAYQWHGEGCELVRDATLLASSARFPNQAFRLGAGVYGLQFHPEVTLPILEHWTHAAAHRLVLPGAQSREAQRRGWHDHDAAIGAWLRRFLPRWLGAADDRAAAATQAPVEPPA